MQKGIKPVVGLFITLMLATINVCSQQVRAECSFVSPDVNPTIMSAMPAQAVTESDVTVGIVAYSGETVEESYGLSCDGNERVYSGYSVLADADYSGVLPGVYKVTVFDIGFHVARAENKIATFTGDNLITPRHYIGRSGSRASSDPTYHVGAGLAVIDTVQSGTLDTGLFNVDYQMGNLITAKLRFGPTVVDMLTNTCNLVSRDIVVLMGSVTSGSLPQGYSSVLIDDSFEIEVADCTVGTHISYRFVSVGSTGVTDDNILNAASGEGVTNGVGVQILDKDNHVLSFDQGYMGIESATRRGAEEVLLKARYVKTGTVRGGQVDVVATFEMYCR